MKLNKETKSSIAFALASTISAGISYLTTPIFTRLLNSDEFGQVSVFLTWQSMLAIVALFSLNYGVFNNGMMDYQDDRDNYSFSLLGLSNLITLLTGSIFSIYIIVFNPSLFAIKYVLVIFVVFLVQPAYNFWLARQRYEYKYKSAFIASVLIGIIAPVVSVSALLFIPLDNKVDIRILSLEGVLFFMYLYFYLLLGKRASWHCNTKYWKEAFLFNLPLIPHYLSVFVLSSSDKIMISKLVGDYATGYYSIAYTIASIGLIIWTAINGSLIPYTYENCKNNNFKKLSETINILLVLVTFVSILVILVAPEIMTFMATKEYMGSLAVIPVIVGGLFFQIHYSLYANLLYYYRRPTWVMVSSILAAILNIILNFIFIPKYGYLAAGYTTLACYLVQATLDCIAVRIVVKKYVYNMKYILCFSFFILIVSLFGGRLYEYSVIRYALFPIVISGSLIMYKKMRKSMVA